MTETYGIRTFDLGTNRDSRGDYEDLYLTGDVISTYKVPEECYLRLGSKDASPIDLREVHNIRTAGQFEEAYLQNPAGLSGTLELLIGDGVTVRKKEELNASSVDVTDDTSRDLGRVNSIQGNVSTVTPGLSNTYSDSHGSGGSFTSQSVPDGYQVAYKADPGNTDNVTVDGVPLVPGEVHTYMVSDVSVPSTSVPTSGDTIWAFVEVA